jgi:7-cyano-7-deazaguanine reductase
MTMKKKSGEKPDAGLLISMPYEYPGKKILVDISTPEFTCLCPWSGQPDFAGVTVKYVPKRLCVELKSLKLYLQSYRNVGMVHESVVNLVLEDVARKVLPQWISVTAEFNVRGGITTVVSAERGKR